MKILKNNDNFEKKEYFYEINEFGKIQGNFSLNEFDELKDSIRKNVILRLSKKIQNNQFFQKVGRNNIKIVNISSLPKNIVIDKMYLDESDKEL